MIHYAPLWKTMADQNATTYTLRFKHGMKKKRFIISLNPPEFLEQVLAF